MSFRNIAEPCVKMEPENIKRNRYSYDYCFMLRFKCPVNSICHTNYSVFAMLVTKTVQVLFYSDSNIRHF